MKSGGQLSLDFCPFYLFLVTEVTFPFARLNRKRVVQWVLRSLTFTGTGR